MGRVVDLALRALVLALTLSAPVLLAGALAAALFGAAASAARVTEPSITQVPRALAVALTLAALGGYGASALLAFTRGVLSALPSLSP